MKKALLLLSLVMVLFSSCETGEIKNETILKAYMVTRTIDKETKEIEVYNNLVTYRIDWVKSVMDIKVNSIDPKETDEVIMRNIALKNTTEGYKFDVASIIPEVNGKPEPDAIITNMTGVLHDIEIRYNFETPADKVYTMVEDPGYPYSTTNVVDVNSPENPYNTSKIQFIVDLDVSKMTADIKIFGAKFADKMPAMDMIIPGVPVIATEKGFELKAESIIPKIKETPYPTYVMTNLSASIINADLSLNFICAGKYNTTVNATMHEPKKPN